MVEGLETSPLKDAPAVADKLRAQCLELVEETTTRGFRVKLKI